MNASGFGEYNRDQQASFQAIERVCADLPPSELDTLRAVILPYLQFRADLEHFQSELFDAACRSACFDTGLSACCGFESIYTFFADQAITWLFSSKDERVNLLRVLDRPNLSRKCVYLAEEGCLWKVRPVSCAMLLCDRLKDEVFTANPDALHRWRELQEREKDYTRPDKPVLFDDLERYFMELGVDSPHMYYHKSPGLLRMKAKAGLVPSSWKRPGSAPASGAGRRA